MALTVARWRAPCLRGRDFPGDHAFAPTPSRFPRLAPDAPWGGAVSEKARGEVPRTLEPAPQLLLLRQQNL